MNVTNPGDFHGAMRSLAAEIGDVETIFAPDRAPLTFSGLLECVTGIRTTLNRIGIGRGDRVVAALPNGPETAVCFFGVAACATFVPLNPEYTEDEFSRYLARLRPRAIIVRSGSGDAIKNAATRSKIPVLELNAVEGRASGVFELEGDEIGACRDPEWGSAEDVALILLTSGTTARPKLVPLRQRHLLALVRAGNEHYALGTQDRSLHVMPMFHGHGLKSGLVVPVLSGSGVICLPRFDVPSFFANMAALRPTWYSASYTIQQSIVERIDDYRRVAREAGLRFIVSGSGRIDPRIVRGLEAAFGCPVIDRYSMSETGVLTSMPLPPGVAKPGTVGTPVINEVRIMDAYGAMLPANREGEVVARGPSVFEGYLDEPEASTEAFRDGWFRTGDLGRLDDDGYLTIVGRIKELINRGGEKIGPAEVERAIAEHPAVARVCVFGIPHATLGEEVAAAVVPIDGALVSEKAIVDVARKHLVSFKVPRVVMFTSELPQTAAGKIDRRALANAVRASQPGPLPDADIDASLPACLDDAVTAIWRKLLRTEFVRPDLDFFLAGGDSLRLAELLVSIRQQFGVQLSMRDILDDGVTVRGFVRLIEQAQHGAGHSSHLPIGLLPINAGGDRLPLFGVPGSDGYPGSFVHLGRLIDARQPFYGLQSRGLDGVQTPLDRIEDIAHDHVDTIRSFQPEGPYLLIGACFGGRVAYEMARQLEAAGGEIALLAMLDPSPRSPIRRAGCAVLRERVRLRAAGLACHASSGQESDCTRAKSDNSILRSGWSTCARSWARSAR